MPVFKNIIQNSSGYITITSQPAFLVYSGGFNVTGGTWQIISTSLTSVNHNIGSHFNTSNGRFTAPVAGRYYFYAGGWASSASEGSRYAMSVTINGGSQLYLTGGDYCNVDSPLAGYSVVFNLNANDYVELQCFTAVSTQWGGGHYLYFGGYLLG